MVTGDKPDEQVDWGSVAAAVAAGVCSVPECTADAVARFSIHEDRVELYCFEHVVVSAVGAGVQGLAGLLERAGVVIRREHVVGLHAYLAERFVDALEVVS